MRECREETGCTLKDLTFLCSHNPSNGMSDSVCHVFGARVNSEASGFDTDEVSEKMWVSKEKCLAMLKKMKRWTGFLFLQFCLLCSLIIDKDRVKK